MAKYETIRRDELRKLSSWVDDKVHHDFQLLYRASRDGCNSATFHQMCDNKGPTVTVVYGTTGHVFGGYTPLAWRQNGNWTADLKSFLFTLRCPTGPQLQKLIANGNSQVFMGTGYGPLFGCKAIGHTLQTLQSNCNAAFDGNGVVKPGFSINIENNAFNRGNMTNQMFFGGTDGAYDIEVYNVKESKLLPEEQAWRKMDEGFQWKSDKLKEDVIKHKAPESLKVPDTRILLLGPSGVGKSSFFNTINSAFRGHVTSQAATGSGKHSVTTKLRVYKVRTGEGKALNLRLCDMMGFEEDGGLILHDVPYILDGNVQDKFQFNPISGLTPNHADFQSAPKLKDKVHVAALVLDASTVGTMSANYVDKLKTAVKMMISRDIPCVILLTKVDKVCPAVQDDLTKVFQSAAVLDLVGAAADLVGVSRSHVLPVKNYELEISTEEAVDTLALLALRQMLRFAEDFFFEQLDLLGE